MQKIIDGGVAPTDRVNDSITIEIPGDINSLEQQIALQWRRETRAAFMDAIKAGYVVVGFKRENDVGKYLLIPKS